MIKGITDKADSLVNKHNQRIFFNSVFWISLFTLFVIVPLRIIFGCTFVDIIIMVIYSIFGVLCWIIGVSHIRRFENESEVKEEQIKRLYELTITDSLTQIRNRSFLFDKLSEMSHSVVNRGIPVSLIIFDVDYFKKFNDTHGHLVGDTILRKIAKVVNDNVRSSDIFGRYGGEEFLIISPNTKLEEARVLAEHARKVVEESTLGEVTISLGVTQIKSEFDIDNALKRADDPMYKAKDEGRNRVMVG